jgi:hypothetical protein
MNKKDEALRFAIEVFENHVEDPRSENLIEKTIKLLKEALEQPIDYNLKSFGVKNEV